MQVPLLDLKAELQDIREQVYPAIHAVVESNQYCNGPAVRELEAQVAQYSGAASAVGVSSGTDALVMALMALEIGPGDEVVTTPFTFFATAGSIARVGARPVFVDIEPDTFNLDPAQLAGAVTPRTRAIIPVHLFGQMAEMDPIMDIARAHKLAVIEDAAQAIGSRYKGRPAGSIGTMGCLSFYPTKNLGAMGDAGMVTTQDAALAQKLAIFRNHGMHETYHHRWVGGNFRMDSVQAAVLSVKLRHLDGWSQARRRNAQQYDALLAGCAGVTTPAIREHNFSIYNQYVIRAARRDELQAFLKAAGVATGIYYPLSLHQQECFAYLGHRAGDFPQSEKAAAEVLALPIHPYLTTEQVAYVAGKIREFSDRQ